VLLLCVPHSVCVPGPTGLEGGVRLLPCSCRRQRHLGEAWDVEVTAFCIARPVCRVSGAAARIPASWVLPLQACLELRGLL